MSNSSPIEGMTATQFWLRLLWATTQLVAAWFFMSSADPFFYQGF